MRKTRSIFKEMVSAALHLGLILLTMYFTITTGVPPKTDTKQAVPMLPAILSGDQSLPTNMALPIDAIPKDLMTGGMNPPMVQAVPAVSNGITDTGNQVPMQPNMEPTMSGQAKYPVTMDSGNNMAVSALTNSGQVMNQAASMNSATNAAGYTTYQTAMGIMNPPMSINFMQWRSSMPANMVLMNIQMACSSLQNFVLGTPMAREIMASVTNMNIKADTFKRPKQCGFPALSAALRMFLKTCNMYSSCSNPTYGPMPLPQQPISPAVPNSVQQTNPVSKSQPVVPKPQKAYQPQLTSSPTVGPTYRSVQTQMMRMINWLYNFRSPQTKVPAVQQKQASSTGGSSGVSDD